MNRCLSALALCLAIVTGSAASGTARADDGATLTREQVEVIVRETGLEITNGKAMIAALPREQGEPYDMHGLSNYLVALKREHPDKEDASVLLEPDIAYDYLIRVMDVVRSMELPPENEGEEPLRVALFPDIAIGDAP
jgi:hypothetical protein